MYYFVNDYCSRFARNASFVLHTTDDTVVTISHYAGLIIFCLGDVFTKITRRNSSYTKFFKFPLNVYYLLKRYFIGNEYTHIILVRLLIQI